MQIKRGKPMKEKIETLVNERLATCPEEKHGQVIYRVHRLRVIELIAELSTLIQQEREEAVRGFYKWYVEHPATMSNKPMVEQYLQSLDKGDRVKSGGTLTTATTDTVDYSTTDIEHLKKNGLITETATEIEKWTKAIKEASSYEGKLYARDRLRELKGADND